MQSNPNLTMRFPQANLLTIISGITSDCSQRVSVDTSLRSFFSSLLNLKNHEATHMTLWTMSDRGIPRSLRMMQGFGVNTYTLQNEAGQLFFVKFHWIPELGVHSFTWDEALKICGQDPGKVSLVF